MQDTQGFKFTQEGYENLKKELEKLISRRPQVVINLTNAREQGDLSENAGYHAAKEELGQIDSRVKELKYLLRMGKVVADTKGASITFGSKVTVEVNGEKMQFQIVEELEADPAHGKISTSSPIGSALVNKKTGDQVSINTPAGKTLYRIKEVG